MAASYEARSRFKKCATRGVLRFDGGAPRRPAG
eukprot:CAMPEP_0184269892 /NCGR_PEP_ID=MMETSP0977-20130417/35857_1 /TAXON_ID=483370 /ORGANISM="non described non described, Strain CCMP2097" /LENGTH=32 /DNA_ID= /DNA_START= /DNA_END= /DNA_ORIENTATION=